MTEPMPSAVRPAAAKPVDAKPVDAKPAEAKPSATNHDITDQLVYPLLARLVAHIPPEVHPNVLTGAAITSGLVASAALAFSAGPASYLACAALLVAWILLDSCDGIHARRTGQCSAFGSFLDHFGDAFAFFVLQAAILYRFDIREPVVFGAMLLRQALGCWTYVIRGYAGHLYITRLGWSTEIYAYTALMIALFVAPTFHIGFGPLPNLNILEAALLIYYVAVPLTLLEIGWMVFRAKAGGAEAGRVSAPAVD
ncbi:CDP-alcohol phosphatidyltransferase family protein [Segnochrobactrum spirostomi]|uniref:CDP-alcohol phosphatidyltransferase family protein n=1 Tax=Segnochrobactrum spirostomi TaxID=2608987 RepID=A0A6A7Y6F0_9HYPH|nr:CDP-alcohol phosphatidyltransferase family protein [Segnochrobactrum spirostomi]MQT14880.1 CDP-alcohol phosphatidyltransferase family protein [Segnochrobactrum spirostomi]